MNGKSEKQIQKSNKIVDKELNIISLVKRNTVIGKNDSKVILNKGVMLHFS